MVFKTIITANLGQIVLDGYQFYTNGNQRDFFLIYSLRSETDIFKIDFMSKFKTIVAILILLTIIIFTFQNIETVSISFLFWNVEVSRALLMLFCFLSGILVASLISFSKKNRYH